MAALYLFLMFYSLPVINCAAVTTAVLMQGRCRIDIEGLRLSEHLLCYIDSGGYKQLIWLVF